MPDRDEPLTQETPEGLTIPVPSREDVEDALRKLVAPTTHLPPDEDDPAEG